MTLAIRARLARLWKDARGVAALEFALIAPPFLLLIMGVFNLGHIMLVDSMLHGAVEKAGRDSTLQSASGATATIDEKVRGQIRTAVPEAVVTFDRRWYQDFANVGKPEPFLDGNANNTRDPGECYQDVNNNNGWDQQSGSQGIGGASLAQMYTVSVTYRHWFPVPELIGVITAQPQTRGNVRMSATTVLRNQPYGNLTTARKICT